MLSSNGSALLLFTFFLFCGTGQSANLTSSASTEAILPSLAGLRQGTTGVNPATTRPTTATASHHPPTRNGTSITAPPSTAPTNGTEVELSNATSASATNATWTNATQPAFDRCETYNHSRRGKCSPYIPMNQAVFIAEKWTQESVESSTESIIQLIQTLGPARNSLCLKEELNFVCSYAFPDCRLTNDGLFTWAVLCNEDCRKTFHTGDCSDRLLQTKIALTAIDLPLNAFLSDDRKNDLNCSGLLTKNQSNGTCMEIPTLPISVQPTSSTPTLNPSTAPLKTDAPATSSSNITKTCGGTAAVDSACHFPFEYNKTEYSECTNEGSLQPWCATQPGDYESHRLWGFCNCTDKTSVEQCHTYESSGVCGQYRQGEIVLVSNRIPLATILSQVKRATSLFETVIRKEEDTDLCSQVFTTVLCYYLFPSCEQPEPGRKARHSKICRETCWKLLYGNCSSSFIRGMQFLQSFTDNLNYKLPDFVEFGTPQCGDLPLKVEAPDCMDLKLNLSYATTAPSLASSPMTTQILVTSPPSNRTIIIASAAAGILFLIVVVTVIAVVSRRRANKKKSIFELFDGSGATNRSTDLSGQTNVKNGTIEIVNPRYEPCGPSGITMKELLHKESEMNFSIDKAAFDATTLMLSGGKSVSEISTNEIKYIRDLGEGEFGMVFLGELVDKTLVAVKVLKEDAGGKNKEEFLKELSIMSQLQHPSIVSLVAQCTTKTSPIECLVFEFMCYGDLGEFLRKSVLADATLLTEAGRKGGKHQIVKDDLLRVIIQLCEACVYLEDKRFVHRDIATRNCLIGEKLVAKVADFGMSRDVYASDYYRIGGKALLPVRWMPPESIVYGKFTLKSDVWSFGILMWEVCTLGKQPYYGKSNEEVVKLAVDGNQLDKPDELRSAYLYSLMKTCWQFEPSARFKFSDLLLELQSVKFT